MKVMTIKFRPADEKAVSCCLCCLVLFLQCVYGFGFLKLSVILSIICRLMFICFIPILLPSVGWGHSCLFLLLFSSNTEKLSKKPVPDGVFQSCINPMFLQLNPAVYFTQSWYFCFCTAMSVTISGLQTFSLQKTSHGSSHNAGMCLIATPLPRSNITGLLELWGQLWDVGMEKGSSISLFVRVVLEQLK